MPFHGLGLELPYAALLGKAGSSGPPSGFAFKLDGTGAPVNDGTGQPILIRIA